MGVVVYYRRYEFNQGREASILAGRNLIGIYNNLGSQNLLNYVQNSRGVTLSASYPLRKSFARIGVTLGYDISNVKTLTTAADSYFQYINFSGVSGPNSLEGIRTSTIYLVEKGGPTVLTFSSVSRNAGDLLDIKLLAKYLGLDARDMEHAQYQVALIRDGMDPVLAKFGTLNFRKLCDFPFDTMPMNDTFLARCLVTEAHTGKKKNFIWF